MKHSTDNTGRETMNLWPTAARKLGLGKNGVYEAALRGEIPGAFRIGGRWLVSITAFESFLENAGREKPLEKTA
jgi:hypothetical protein